MNAPDPAPNEIHIERLPSLFWRRADLRRLCSAINVWNARLSGVRRDSARDGTEGEPDGKTRELILVRCEQFLKIAKDNLQHGHIDPGWDALHQLEEEYMWLLSPAEREGRWISAIAEAEKKLSNWRASAVHLLAVSTATKPTGQIPEEPLKAIAKLQYIVRHLNERSENIYFNIERLRRQLWVVAGLLALVVFAVVVVQFVGIELTGTSGNLLLFAVSAGFIGGVASLAFSVVRSSSSTSIPELRTALSTTLIRPLIGAALALPIYWLIDAHLVPIENTSKDEAILAFSFFGGFSERWFLGLVERVAGDSK